ncbi:MAG: iron ABC transporter substrate-binding protein [Acidimicrobiia bacterium]
MNRCITYSQAVALAVLAVLPGCGVFDSEVGGAAGADLVIYSGRGEALIGDLINQFEEDSGLDVKVRYGQSPGLANALIEEGEATPADVFFSQDSGSLGALVAEDRLIELDQEVLDRVPAAFRSDGGFWVGTSGRSRVVVFNPERISEEELPDSVLDFADPEWKDRVGWAPPNASFQSFVTALRLVEGEEAARGWLEGMVLNDTLPFPNNIQIVEAVGEGEIDVGLVNHYYLPEMKEQNPGISAENHFIPGGDVGGLINVAGVGILAGDDVEVENARRFVDYLLSETGQEYFVTETHEYPLIEGVEPDESLPSLAELDPPDVDLSNLQDLQGTQKLLGETGAL